MSVTDNRQMLVAAAGLVGFYLYRRWRNRTAAKSANRADMIASGEINVLGTMVSKNERQGLGTLQRQLVAGLEKQAAIEPALLFGQCTDNQHIAAMQLGHHTATSLNWVAVHWNQ